MTQAATSDFKVRFISAIVLAPIVLGLAFLGGYWFAALCLCVSVIMFWEWTVMTLRSVDVRRDALCLLLIVAGLVAVILTGSVIVIELFLALVLVGVLCVSRGLKTGWSVLGLGLAGGFSASLILIREIEENGLGLLVFLALSVWAADICAYLVGRTVGGPKLAPRISPNKTWSGFLGGLVGAMGVGFGASIALFERYDLGWAAFALLLALAAQGGDLVESSIKRRFNVKDTSNLIPGHGGILDRVDGLILAAFVFVLFYAIGLSPHV